tara:strand:- start:144 stop:359 length:216 start_codon:yes stop_codon:yes gene_type:complete
MDLESAIKIKGKTVTQIIHFITGEKRTIEGIITKTVKQGQFTKFELLDGSYVMINDKNVLMIEVFSESDVK